MKFQHAFLIASTGLIATGVSAQQTVTFSLASDNSSDAATFGSLSGGGSQFFDIDGASEEFSLLVDDNNGPLPTLEFAGVNVEAGFGLESLGATEIAAGLFNHLYSVSGSFVYVDSSSGDTLLSAAISGGVMSVLGTENAWASAGAIVSTDVQGAELTYLWSGETFADYGLFAGEESLVDSNDDAVFTLTVISSDAGSGVALGTDGLPSAQWSAEASFSGSATFIPAPGTLALLAGAGGLVARRRR